MVGDVDVFGTRVKLGVTSGIPGVAILVLPKFSSELMQRTGTGRTEPTVRFWSSSVQPLKSPVQFSVLRFPRFSEPVQNLFERI
jgi:hypothetical protein